MKLSVIIFYLLLLGLTCMANAVQITNKDNVAIEADLISLQGNQVELSTKGRTFEIPLNTLSEESQKLVEDYFRPSTVSTKKMNRSIGLVNFEYTFNKPNLLSFKITDKTGDITKKWPFRELDIKELKIDALPNDEFIFSVSFKESFPNENNPDLPYRLFFRFDMDNNPGNGLHSNGFEFHAFFTGWRDNWEKGIYPKKADEQYEMVFSDPEYEDNVFSLKLKFNKKPTSSIIGLSVVACAEEQKTVDRIPNKRNGFIPFSFDPKSLEKHLEILK